MCMTTQNQSVIPIQMPVDGKVVAWVQFLATVILHVIQLNILC